MADKGFFGRLFEGLGKTRSAIAGKIDQLVKYYKNIDDDFFDQLEAVLISADIGAAVSLEAVERLKAKVKAEKLSDNEQIHTLLRDILRDLIPQFTPEDYKYPLLILIVGVNGVGKTTAIGKLANMFTGYGKRVLLAAGDTFRAAADDQLAIWAERSGAQIVHNSGGADPAAVIFDAVQAAEARAVDVIICDTAGRLHNKKNLMEELAKINRVIDRNWQGSRKNYLVLDATTGQNMLPQAESFAEATGLDGLILTKMDGTARGGAAIGVMHRLGIPVRYIGIGEGIDDLKPFDTDAYLEAII